MKLILTFSATFALWLDVSFVGVGAGSLAEDEQALIDFLATIPHGRRLKWSPATSVCSNWTGITCSADGSRVIAVRLPEIGFSGPIPPNTLSRLSALQILSLHSNNLTGSFRRTSPISPPSPSSTSRLTASPDLCRRTSHRGRISPRSISPSMTST